MLKDKEKRKDAARDRQRKHRQGVTGQGVTGQGVTLEFNAKSAEGTPYVAVETVPASYVQGLNGKMYQSLPERPRYLKLSSLAIGGIIMREGFETETGFLLDRLNQPTPNISGDMAMQACNESYNYKPNESSKERVKAMVKEATG